jgi:hypothetical protein
VSFFGRLCRHRIEKALVDQAFKSWLVMHGTRVGIDVEIVQRKAA